MRHAIVFVTLALLVTACAAPSAPAPAPTVAAPTLSNTLQPTPSPSPSPSPEPSHTPTLIPSVTPSPVLSLTPSFYFTMPSPTPVASHELDCQVVSQSVVDGTSFNPGERFVVNWKVTNTGTATWFPASVDFAFAGGSKMYQYSPVRLQHSVPPGQTAGLSADMRAPNNSTTYTTIWSLRRGADYFCQVRVTIWVLATPTPEP